MLFTKSALGYIPTILNQEGRPTAAGVTTGGPPGNPNGFCTSDSKLVFWNGAWRVRSVDQQPCTALIASEDINYVEQNEPVYVGPFKIDLTNTKGQITTYRDPEQIGADWGAWITQAWVNTSAAMFKAAGHKPQAEQTVAYFFPDVIGETQRVIDNGTPNGTTNYPFAQPLYGIQAGAPTQPYSVSASTVAPRKAWRTIDQHNHPIMNVIYDSDPSTVYEFYSIANWIDAFQGFTTNFDPANRTVAVPSMGWLSPSNTTQFNRNQNVPPIAKFKHPTTGDLWGIWVSLVPEDAQFGSGTHLDGYWVVSLDRPASYVLQVGIGPMPQEGWWDNFLDAIETIPYAIGIALWDIGQFVSQLSCDLVNNSSMLAKVPKDPASQAAAAGALLLATAGCPQPPKLDCKATPNAPGCVVPAPVTPWWQQWYVIVPALGVLGFIVFKALGSPSRSAATA